VSEQSGNKSGTDGFGTAALPHGVIDQDRIAATKLYAARNFESLARAITKPKANRLAEAFAQHRLAAYEEAALICEAQRDVFGEATYATDQPLSSFKERFACTQCAEGIRSRITGASNDL